MRGLVQARTQPRMHVGEHGAQVLARHVARLRPVLPRIGCDLAWATQILQRSDASSYCRRVALEALNRQG